MCPILASTIWCFLEVTTGLKALWVSTDQSVAQLLLLQALPRALLCSRVITVINNYQEKKKVSFFLADAFYWVWIKLLWLSTFYEMNKGMILAKVFFYSCHMLSVRLYPSLSQWRTAGAQALFSLVSTCSDVTYFFAVSWQSQTVLLIAVLVYWVISADRALLGSVPALKKPFLPPKLKVHLSKAELIRREL